MLRSNGNKGATVVTPTRTSCRKVLYLEIWVGWTEADGIEKSQYRVKVFCDSVIPRSGLWSRGGERTAGEKREVTKPEVAKMRSGSRKPRWTGRRRGRE